MAHSGTNGTEPSRSAIFKLTHYQGKQGNLLKIDCRPVTQPPKAVHVTLLIRALYFRHENGVIAIAMRIAAAGALPAWKMATRAASGAREGADHQQV